MHKGASSRKTLFSRVRRTATRLTMGVGAVAMMAACSADTVAGPSAPRNGLLSGVLGTVGGAVNGLLNVTGLELLNGVTQPIVRSVTFTKEGGKIDIPETGFSLKVPAGAIPGESLTITVTALPGKMVAYDFQPHGTEFLKPLSFEQDLEKTGWGKTKPKLTGGYFKSLNQVNASTATALVDEELDVSISYGKAKFSIWHFSGYMMSTGRSSVSFEPSEESAN